MGLCCQSGPPLSQSFLPRGISTFSPLDLGITLGKNANNQEIALWTSVADEEQAQTLVRDLPSPSVLAQACSPLRCLQLHPENHLANHLATRTGGRAGGQGPSSSAVRTQGKSLLPRFAQYTVSKAVKLAVPFHVQFLAGQIERPQTLTNVSENRQCHRMVRSGWL